MPNDEGGIKVSGKKFCRLRKKLKGKALRTLTYETGPVKPKRGRSSLAFIGSSNAMVGHSGIIRPGLCRRFPPAGR
ncbi:MAG: hypothetical protein KDD06_03115, partial [Phaeodactylibacter sp.]|nr:hypothetical protein [Phaeodactylibacter sp.]